MKHPAKDLERRVAIVGCKHTTLELILGLARAGYGVDHCVTISPAEGERQKVAGYLDLRRHLDERGIPHTTAHTYSLKSDEDKTNLLDLGLDMLLVIGWQRLIPAWWLDALAIGAFGMHGSSRPLPHGRGRSPMNWSLIQGKKEFYAHLFRYRPGVDDGEIAGVQRFDINPFDTAYTMHLKATVSMIKLCVALLPGLLDGSATLSPQPTEGPTYYPKRSAEDGLLYWSDPTESLYNLIRAVTRPFPGAFGYLDDDPSKQVFIWKAQPFDTQLMSPEAAPGEIVHVFIDGSFVVKSGAGSIYVTESEGHRFTNADIGRCFGTLDTPRKDWGDMPN